MSGIIAAVVTLALVFGTIGGIIFFVIWLHRYQTKKRQMAWAAVAREHGLHHTGEQIVGTKYGQSVRVYTEARGSGKNRTVYTVVSSPLTTPIDLGLNVRRHGFFNNMFHRSADIAVGDAAFDEAFIVSADEPARVRAVLGAKVRQLLLKHLAQGPTFHFNDHGTSIERVGVSTSTDWLGWAVEVCARASHKLDGARNRVPVASALAHHRPAWAAFAKARNLSGLDTPLCMWGRIDGTEVYAYAVRTAPHRYQLEVSLRFAAPLNIGLSVQPKGLMDKVAVFFGGQDHRFHDPMFDDAFRVKALYPDYANEVLDAPVRGELLALQADVGPLSLTDAGLAVRLPTVPHEPAAVPRIVQQLTGITERIGNRALTDGVGPYR